MISEPELVGGVDHPVGEPLRAQEPAAPGLPRRPWPWALGGALVASALWAGGLYAYESRPDPGPDMRGYKSVAGTCGKMKLEALSGVLGEASWDATVGVEQDPALEYAMCPVTFGPPETGYSGLIEYTRHLVTDPGPEFDARAKPYEMERLEGLGERAYVVVEGNESARLRVLDGQVELEISFNAQESWNEDREQPAQKTKKIDLSGIDQVMAQDMAALMAALKK
ncbi:hypothetical protein ACGFMM_03835 [Streptomyces sp. NPDC048604]|uniref:hypothetical protein n=1 Tax=Streptomyces sp. NPDC048604 TaxID=3365578 RepID=UPI003712FCA1